MRLPPQVTRVGRSRVPAAQAPQTQGFVELYSQMSKTAKIRRESVYVVLWKSKLITCLFPSQLVNLICLEFSARIDFLVNRGTEFLLYHLCELYQRLVHGPGEKIGEPDRSQD